MHGAAHQKLRPAGFASPQDSFGDRLRGSQVDPVPAFLMSQGKVAVYEKDFSAFGGQLDAQLDQGPELGDRQILLPKLNQVCARLEQES